MFQEPQLYFNCKAIGGSKMSLREVKKHTKPSAANPQGGIVEKEASIHISNVALLDANGKATKVGYKVDGDKKVRIAKTTGKEI